MPEKAVALLISSELRAKIKKLKHELTYEQFLNNLIKKSKGSPCKENQITNKGDSIFV